MRPASPPSEINDDKRLRQEYHALLGVCVCVCVYIPWL